MGTAPPIERPQICVVATLFPKSPSIVTVAPHKHIVFGIGDCEGGEDGAFDGLLDGDEVGGVGDLVGGVGELVGSVGDLVGGVGN